MPGLVDAHVHLNEPGRTEWEGFETGTRAAAFGGVTTVIDMPLNAIPPTTTVGGLREKIAAAAGKCWVDVGFYGGVVPGNVEELKGLVEAGVRGFKGFLIDSGVCVFFCFAYLTQCPPPFFFFLMLHIYIYIYVPNHPLKCRSKNSPRYHQQISKQPCSN